MYQGRRTKSTQNNFLSHQSIWWLSLVAIAGIWGMGCPAPPPPTTLLVLKSVQIASPKTGEIFNTTNDADKNRPGVQVDVKVTITTEGTGDFPSGVQATLTTNGRNEATVNVNGADLLFQGYTLEEGANVLQVKLKIPNSSELNSPTVQVNADSQCYQLQILSPKDGDLFGERDDENKTKAGFQQTVVVKINREAAENVTLVVTDAQGKETTVEKKPFEGDVVFDEVTLPEGDITLLARTQDASGNQCQSSPIKLKIRLQSPAVEITAPAANQKICPKDDVAPQEADMQLDVQVKTSAEDGSEAVLFLDGQKYAGPKLVSGGLVTFRLTLPTVKPVTEHKLLAEVTDKLGNKGTSEERQVAARVSGYNLRFVGLLDGQTIPPSRDKDPNKPEIQLDIDISTSAPDGTEVTLEVDGTPVKLKAQGGAIKHTLDLKEGKTCLKVTAIEPSCNVTTTTVPLCLEVKPLNVPTLSCSLTEKGAPAFDSNKQAKLNANHDADAQTAGIQNNIKCLSDAEKDQTVEFDFNGQKQTGALINSTGNLREVTFANLTFQEGKSTLIVKVTNTLGKTETQTYEVEVDTSSPTAVTDLAAVVEDHRKASVKLSWTTTSDGTNTVGLYDVRYSSLLTTITQAEWDKPEGNQEAKSTKMPGEKEELVVSGLSIGKTYTFAIRAKDGAGNLSDISNVVSIKIEFKKQDTAEHTTSKTSYGISAAVVGDLDLDGTPDTVVCASRAPDGAKANAGAAYIYYGRKPTVGSYLPTSPDVTIAGEDAGVQFCQQVIPLGDINGDGFADFAVRTGQGGGGQGRVYFFFGGQRGTTLKNGNAATLARVIITGPNTTDLFGNYITTGDFNGDNKADVLVSALSSANTGLQTKGAVYIFYSRAAYPSATQPALQLSITDADVTIVNDTEPNGSRGTAFFGIRVVAKDIDKDGKPDILISSMASNKVLGFFGALSPVNKVVKASTAQLRIEGNTGSAESFGTAFDLIGDVDKDSKQDLLIASNRGTMTGFPAGSGQVWLISGTKLVRGAQLKADTDAAVSWGGQASNLLLGSVVTGVGDINNDGFDDFVISEGAATDPGNGNLSAGAVYLFFGQKLTSYTSGAANKFADITWYGSAVGSQLGLYFVGVIPDVTGDSYADLLMTESPSSTRDLKGQILLKH